MFVVQSESFEMLGWLCDYNGMIKMITKYLVFLV